MHEAKSHAKDTDLIKGSALTASQNPGYRSGLSYILVSTAIINGICVTQFSTLRIRRAPTTKHMVDLVIGHSSLL